MSWDYLLITIYNEGELEIKMEILTTVLNKKKFKEEITICSTFEL